MVNPSNPASGSRHYHHAQNSKSYNPPVNAPSTSRHIPFQNNNVSTNEPEQPSRKVSFSKPLVRHSSQGFAVSSTDAFNQNYQHPTNDDYNDKHKHLNIPNNGDIVAYPVKIKEDSAKKPTKIPAPSKKPTPPTTNKKPVAASPIKKPTSPTPTKKPASPKPTKGKVASSSVQFRKTSNEEEIRLNEEQKRKINRRQTGKLGVKNGKVSQINFDDEDESEADEEVSNKGSDSKPISPRNSFGSEGKPASPRNSFGSGNKPASPRNSVGSGSYKEATTTPPPVDTPAATPPERVSDDQLLDNTETAPETDADSPEDCPEECWEEEGEKTSEGGCNEQENYSEGGSGGCNTTAPGCTCGGGQGTKHIQATLLQCYQVPYCNDHQNHGKSLIEKRKNHCCQLAYNCCCQPASPTFKPCSCRRCRVYHYCYNVLNRSQVKPDDMYIGISKYEELVRQKENANNSSNNTNDMSCQQNSSGAKNWTNGPPEGYTDNPRDTAQGAQGPFVQPSDRGASILNPACCFTTSWQTEYSSQFTDFSDQMRKGRSKYPSYEDGGMGRGRGGNCGASPCCGGGCGGGKQTRQSFCYDSRNQNSGCGNYVQMPEEEELHVSRLGGEILCCATGNSSSCRPPSYYACQMYEMTQTNTGSCNNNNVMDDDEYNTRRFKTNELMPSCGPGVDNSRSRPTSHWVAGGGGGGNFGGCEDDSTSNFVPKLETLPARRDDYETSYALSGGGSSKKKRKSSDGSTKRKKTSFSNNSEEHGMASAEKAKRDEKKESKKKKKKHEDTDYDVSKNPTASHATTKATASRATTASKNTASHATTLADPDEEKEAEGQSRMIDDGIDDVDTIIHGLDFQD